MDRTLQTSNFLGNNVHSGAHRYFCWTCLWYEFDTENICNSLQQFAISLNLVSVYTIEKEHGGLRQIAGYGVTVTRGAASAMMFTYATLLLTMCRNIITRLRETFLHRFIPFDYFVVFHKYVAILGLIFTLVHIIGHGFNFYHISTQTPSDVSCLFRDYFRP